MKTDPIPDTLFVGMPVDYHAIIGGPVTSTGHSVKAIQRSYGRWEIFITGKSGFVCLEALTEAKDNK